MWRMNLSSKYWTLMYGNSSLYNDVGVYSGSNARPPSGNYYAYWQTNGSSLYLFGGWGTLSSGNSKSHSLVLGKMFI
jgi:hypothetical protein